MFVASLQRVKLVDFEIDHNNILYFKILISQRVCFAYVVSFMICCRTIDIIYNMYDTLAKNETMLACLPKI